MRKALSRTASAVIIMSMFLLFFTGNVSAAIRPLNCGTQAFNNQASIASGSTSAAVKLVVWKACDGGYYAAAYSYADTNGFVFHGTLHINVQSGPDFYSSSSVYCNGSQSCDGKEVYPYSGDYVWGVYEASNGTFYYCSPPYNGGSSSGFQGFQTSLTYIP